MEELEGITKTGAMLPWPLWLRVCCPPQARAVTEPVGLWGGPKSLWVRVRSLVTGRRRRHEWTLQPSWQPEQARLHPAQAEQSLRARHQPWQSTYPSLFNGQDNTVRGLTPSFDR